MNGGDLAWLAIGVVFLALLSLPRVAPRWLVAPSKLVAYVVASWPGRVGLFALWSYGGFHLLCQRP